MILYMHIAPGQGLTTLWEWNFDINRNILSLRSFVASFKNLFEVWFYTFLFHDYIHVYSPRARVDSPQGQILMSTERPYHFTHLLQVSKKSLWSLILYIFFFHLIHVYSLEAGADSPQGQSFDVNRNVLSFHSFVASFKTMSLKSDFIQFFHDLIHVYSPRAGGIQPPSDKVLMSTETSCHFGHQFLVSNQRRQQSIVLPFSHTKA